MSKQTITSKTLNIRGADVDQIKIIGPAYIGRGIEQVDATITIQQAKSVPDMIEVLKEIAAILDKIKADSPEGVKYVLIHHKIKSALRKAGQID